MSVEQVERLRVAWVDTDAGGRIHFTAAFRWAEVAETALMRGLGLIDGWGSYPRRHVEADFHKATQRIYRSTKLPSNLTVSILK